jgi:hypothetical protein
MGNHPHEKITPDGLGGLFKAAFMKTVVPRWPVHSDDTFSIYIYRFRNTHSDIYKNKPFKNLYLKKSKNLLLNLKSST